MSETVCRWGILGAANIARKNWHSIAQSGNGRVVAVASRSQQKAQAFIDSCQLSVPVPHTVDAVAGYDALLSRDDIDAVYFPLPTGVRTEWVIRAANAGKHVLVEKPCGVSSAEVQAIINACTANNVQFMDGVMFMHSTRLPEIRRILDGSAIGTIRRITSHFSFSANDDFVESNIRGSSALEPAGCLGDLGWYTIRFTLWALNYEMPTEVRGRVLAGARRADSTEAVPMEFQCEMHFASGVSATMFNSFRTGNEQWAHVSGSNGYLYLNDFVLPFFDRELHFEVANHEFDVIGCRFNMARHSRTITVNEYSNNAPDSQETRLFRTFADLVNSGRPDPHWPEIAMKTQQVMDAALKSARNNGERVTL